MKRQESRNTLAILNISGAKSGDQFPFFQTDHEKSEHPPNRQDQPQSRSPNEQCSSYNRADHSRIARVPYIRVKAPREHLACPGEFRVTYQSAAAQLSFDARKQIDFNTDARESQSDR